MTCNPITLVGISLDCGSVGGLSSIYVTDVQNVSSVTIVDGEVTAIAMEDATKFSTFNFRKGNASFSATGNRNDENGTLFYNTVLEAKFNKMETAKRNEMKELTAGNTYVIAKDNNAKYWLIGYGSIDNTGSDTLETYAFGNTNANTGAAYADANQYVLTLTSDTPQLPYEVDSSIMAALLEPAISTTTTTVV